MSAPWLTHLDRPTHPGDADQLRQRRRRRPKAGVEGQLLGIVNRAAGKQPEPHVGRPAVAVQRHPSPVVQAPTLGTLPGADPQPLLGRNLGEQLLGGNLARAVGGPGPQRFGALGPPARRRPPAPPARSAAAGRRHRWCLRCPPGRHPSRYHALQHGLGELGLVQKATWSGTPASARRAGSSVQQRGRYSSRSTRWLIPIGWSWVQWS